MKIKPILINYDMSFLNGGLLRVIAAGDAGAVGGTPAGQRLAAGPLTGPESQPECDQANGLNKTGGEVSQLR